MSINILEARLVLRNGTEAEWLAVADTAVPLAGEPCVTLDGDNAGGLKLGDGISTWGALPYLSGTALQETITKLETLETAVEGKLDSVSSADASLTVDTTDETNPTVKVAISADSDNALSLEADGLKVTVGAAPEYEIKKLATANANSVASYQLEKDGVATGDVINIPLDYLVKSATVKIADTADAPYAGAAVGDKYLEFTINAATGTGTESYLYIPVNDMVQVYVAGDGVTIDNTTNTIAAKVVAENGLSVDSDGIKLTLANSTTGGAITPEQFDALEDLKTDGYIKKIQANDTQIDTDADGVATIPVATEAKFGVVKSSTEANAVSVDANGIMTVSNITTDVLSNGDNVLVLRGGGAVVANI